MSDGEGQGANPFGETTDPGVYVPRPAADAAVAAVVRAASERRIPAIVGPPGIGKTLVLRRAASVLSRRAWKPVFLPYASLSPDELSRWILGLLDAAPAPSAAPREALLLRAKAEAAVGRGVLILLDEAAALSREAGDVLAGLLWQSDGGLALALAATDDARASRALATLGPDVRVIRYTAPLSESETRAYVDGRLEQRAAPAGLRARFDSDAVAWLHRLSGGIPRRVHDLAAHLIEAPPDEVTPAWWKECQAAVEADLAEVAEAARDAGGAQRHSLKPSELPEPTEIDVPELRVDEGDELDLLGPLGGSESLDAFDDLDPISQLLLDQIDSWEPGTS